MATDLLSGLFAELRKAAKTASEIHGLVVIDKISESELWLPAVLVAQEMKRVKRVVGEMRVWHDAECRPGFPCSTCYVLKKIKEAFR